jgi:four helix bundle protein
MKNHKDLEVWKEAVELAVACYDITRTFPQVEQFGLASQMRRAAISVASNIAEGAARAGSKEFVQFLYISLGSASELDTQIEIAKKIGLGNVADIETLQLKVNGVSRMLQGLIRSVRRRTPKSQLPMTNHQSPVTDRQSLITSH